VSAASPRFGRTAWLVAQWSLSELLFSPRTLAMIAIAAAPIGLALVYRIAAAFRVAEVSSGYTAFTAIVAGASLPFVAPMISLFYASGVVSDDVEAGTMPYFLTRPSTRASFLAGKMLASYLMSALLLLVSITAAYYVSLAPAGWDEIGSRFGSLIRDLWVAALGVLAYNGLFALAGTVLRRPLLSGLFFIFGWQAVATFVPGAVRYLTIAHYLHSLMPHQVLQGGLARLIGDRSSVPVSVAALLAIAVATHVIAARVFQRKEIR
jgi:ABC-type transport system involved in multi-copper enzyme maturation permease subunit